jgi:hypothetical protein
MPESYGHELAELNTMQTYVGLKLLRADLDPRHVDQEFDLETWEFAVDLMEGLQALTPTQAMDCRFEVAERLDDDAFHEDMLTSLIPIVLERLANRPSRR